MQQVSFNSATNECFIDRLHDAFLADDDAGQQKSTEAANVRMIQDQYRAIAVGDFAPVIAGLTDDVVMEFFAPPGFPIQGKSVGKTQVIATLGRNFMLVEDQRAEILSVVAQGDLVVLSAREHGRVRETGKPYDVCWVHLFTFRHGKIARLHSITADTSVEH